MFLLNLKIQSKINHRLNELNKSQKYYGVITIRTMFKKVASASKNSYKMYKEYSNENPFTTSFVVEFSGKALGIENHLGFVVGAEIMWRKELRQKIMPILEETVPPYVEHFQNLLFSETVLSSLPLATLALTGLAIYAVGEELNENYITTQDGFTDIKLTKNNLPLFYESPSFEDFKQMVKDLKTVRSIVKK